MKNKAIIRRAVVETPSDFAAQLHPAIARIYSARGLADPGQLRLSLQGLIPPQQLKGMPAALVLLEQAMLKRWRILVVGDFDADGATSSTLAVLALRALGAAQVDYLVPNRFEYGYGLTPEIVAVAQQSEPDLLITVDNGISSHAGVQAAKDAGIRVLVTDHHLPGEEPVNADAIINPNQPGCEFASKNLAGVGVIFYLMVALRAHLQESGWFAEAGIKPPNMAEFLDLVALGTVADVVPLDQNNRILVDQGVRRIRAGQCRPGISALIEIAKRKPENLVATDLGFAVGPRLNAAGRLDDMSAGIECLLASDPVQAKALAEELEQLNAERKSIELSMQQEALKLLNQLAFDKGLPWGLCLFRKDWHQGVIGILASRIKERLHRPVIVFAAAEEQGLLKGSARSIPALHIRDALDQVAAKHPGLISKFGGHAMAAGLSLPEANFKDFQQAFDQAVRNMISPQDLTDQLLSDGELAADELDLPFAQLLRQAGPWGQGFPEPVFDGEFELLQQRIVGERHLKMVFTVPDSNRIIDAIAFNVDVSQWPNPAIKRVHAVYKLDVNEFRNVQSAQLLVEHLVAANTAD